MDERRHTSRPRGARPPFELWKRPKLELQTTTLWEYPSQHYGEGEQGSKHYQGATPSWILWNLLERYTKEGDVVLDPMAGSGTTLDVCRDLNREGLGFDVAPFREDIHPADARSLPLKSGSVDFVFVDPPYSTHLTYSDDPRCIGKIEAPGAYFKAMGNAIDEMVRVLRDRRYLALYVCDSFKKGKPLLPIGFELFSILRERQLKPVDIICVARHNRTLKRTNWHAAAAEGNFFLRGFNYLFVFKKELPSKTTNPSTKPPIS